MTGEYRHCVNWNKMPPGLRQQVFIKTLELFTHTDLALEQIIAKASSVKGLRVLQ